MTDGSAAFDDKKYSVAIQIWEEAMRSFPDEPSLEKAVALAKRELEKERQLREL